MTCPYFHRSYDHIQSPHSIRTDKHFKVVGLVGFSIWEQLFRQLDSGASTGLHSGLLTIMPGIPTACGGTAFISGLNRGPFSPVSWEQRISPLTFPLSFWRCLILFKGCLGDPHVHSYYGTKGSLRILGVWALEAVSRQEQRGRNLEWGWLCSHRNLQK